MNHFILTATVIAKEAIRYTPAGLPVIECQLEHHGEVQEAEVLRKVHLNLSAIAIGSMTQKVDAVEIGKTVKMNGFLSNKSHNSKQIVFHITHIEQ